MKNLKENLIPIGQIYREQGVKGACKVFIYSHDALNLNLGQSYVLCTDEGRQIRTILQSVEPFERYFLVKFDAFQTPEEIIPWRQAKLWVHKQDLKKHLGEHYDFEWVGFSICDAGQKKIGKIVEIEYTPLPNFKVELENGETKLIPIVERWFLKIDEGKKTLVLNLPEGILEI